MECVLFSIILKMRHCLHVAQLLSWFTTVSFKHKMLSSNTRTLTVSIYNDKSYFQILAMVYHGSNFGIARKTIYLLLQWDSI